jgi:Holliday junction resolvase RusA-like endonuclease
MMFTLACIPPKTSHHAKRIVRIQGHARMADTTALNAAKATLETLLLPHQPPTPLTGALVLTLTFTWPWTAADPQRVRRTGRVPHARRPDASNLAKTIEDRLVRLGFLQDDGQVVELVVRKFRGDTPGIAVDLREVALAPEIRPVAVTA